MYYQRSIVPKIQARLFQGKAIIIYGARQVGKTTLVKELLKDYGDQAKYLDADSADVSSSFDYQTPTELMKYIGPARLVVIDEAQRISNIGIKLKLLIDTYPELQIIATGSSSFELANRVKEPLTGRTDTFELYPLSLAEAASHDRFEAQRLLESLLRFGGYPAIVQLGEAEASAALRELASSYLYKDILEHQNLRHAPLLLKLLQALALQLGSEVSYGELAKLLQIDINTIERYIYLLEQVFVIHRLYPLRRNPRREIGRLRKVYFYDLGIRNSLIRNFNPLDIRTDTGALWENFCINERIKQQAVDGVSPNRYFWRDKQQHEIDYVEEEAGQIRGFEFKWSQANYKPPQNFLESYPASSVWLVHKANVLDDFLRLTA